MNKWFKTYVMSIRRDFVCLLIVDAIFLLVMELVLMKIPAPFTIFVRIGDLMVTLIDRNTDMMLNVSAYLDSECMDILMRIQNSETFLVQVRRLFPMCKAGGVHKLQYQIPDPFIRLWHFIEEQEVYYDQVFGKYFGRNWVVIS